MVRLIVKKINYPAASGGVSEDKNGMIMPPHPDPLPPGERERCYKCNLCVGHDPPEGEGTGATSALPAAAGAISRKGRGDMEEFLHAIRHKIVYNKASTVKIEGQQQSPIFT